MRHPDPERSRAARVGILRVVGARECQQDHVLHDEIRHLVGENPVVRFTGSPSLPQQSRDRRNYRVIPERGEESRDPVCGWLIVDPGGQRNEYEC
jgi:hypothetical protein